jgi:hypothetical protein
MRSSGGGAQPRVERGHRVTICGETELAIAICETTVNQDRSASAAEEGLCSGAVPATSEHGRCEEEESRSDCRAGGDGNAAYGANEARPLRRCHEERRTTEQCLSRSSSLL